MIENDTIWVTLNGGLDQLRRSSWESDCFRTRFERPEPPLASPRAGEEDCVRKGRIRLKDLILRSRKRPGPNLRISIRSEDQRTI